MSYEKKQDDIGRLEAWLKHTSYVEGLRLYLELFGETVLYRLLVRSKNSFNVRKLTQELSARLAELKQQTQQQLIEEPSSVAELRRNASALMNERTALKAQIRLLSEEAPRFERAKRILEIGEQLDRIYGQIEFFEINGMVWQAPPEAEVDEALRRYLNLRTYISRTAKALKVAILPKERVKLEQKLKLFQDEKNTLELTEPVKRYNGHAIQS